VLARITPALNFIQSFCFLSLADDLHASRSCHIVQVPWNQYPTENKTTPGLVPRFFLRCQVHPVCKIALCFQQFTNCLFPKSFRMISMRTAPGGGGGKKPTPSEARSDVFVGAGACPSRRQRERTIVPPARTRSLVHSLRVQSQPSLPGPIHPSVTQSTLSTSHPPAVTSHQT
jgi:hypothetical protein